MQYCVVYETELYHHGIKGQRWGVRRYQNADGSLTSAGKARYRYSVRDGDLVIKKGSSLHRVTVNPNETNEGAVYTSFTKNDMRFYRTKFARHLIKSYADHGKTVVAYDMSMKVKDTIVAPSVRHQVDTIVDMSKAKPKEMTSAMTDYFNKNLKGKDTNDNRAYVYMQMRKQLIKSGANDSTAHFYATFMLMADDNKEFRESFFNELKKKGYNAIVDSHDGFASMEAPLIVFNKKDTLEVTKLTRLPDIDSKLFNKEESLFEQSRTKYKPTQPLEYNDKRYKLSHSEGG